MDELDNLKSLIPAWVEGVLTPVGKLDAHERGLQHLAVSVFVMRGGKTLIQQRAAGKYHTPGFWANTCCTHPNWGESTATCAIRRLEDELGITGLVPEYRHRVEYHAEVGGGLIENEVVDVFVAEAPADLKIEPNPSEVQGFRWVDLGELIDEVARRPDQFTPWIKVYLNDHIETIFRTGAAVS